MPRHVVPLRTGPIALVRPARCIALRPVRAVETPAARWAGKAGVGAADKRRAASTGAGLLADRAVADELGAGAQAGEGTAGALAVGPGASLGVGLGRERK